jgi:hypothetical protein
VLLQSIMPILLGECSIDYDVMGLEQQQEQQQYEQAIGGDGTAIVDHTNFAGRM